MSVFPFRWDENIIELAMSWTPGETGWKTAFVSSVIGKEWMESIAPTIFFLVLFIADLKIVYDDYKKTMSSVCDNRTIITVNPGKAITSHP
jgi:hypothetical protein